MENLKEIDKSGFLKEALNSGIIDWDSVIGNIMANKKEQVKKQHAYTITPPAREGGRWQTHYKDATGKRKTIRAQTEDELIAKLVPLYCSNLHADKLDFHSLYEEWLIYKQTVTSSPNTINRHGQHYRKYLEPSPLHGKNIRKIDELFLEAECNRIVKEYNLSRKEWGNLKTIINGMFEYAVRKKYLADNPMSKVRIRVKFRQVAKKTGKTETYNSNELESLNLYLDKMYDETQDSVFLAVKLNFLLGLRVGELAALKWEDYQEGPRKGLLHIVREEVRNQVTGQYSVVDHTKTNQDRYVDVVPKAARLLEKIEHTGPYMFMRGGNRITSRQIAYVLEKYAQRQGVDTKSTHKMRKTYASRLSAHGVPLDCIRELLGHNNLNTTLGYIYNPLTEEETFERISSAL